MKLTARGATPRAIDGFMFANTITARMLRLLAQRGEMQQAEFMSTYHERCARDGTAMSGFLNNFGHYVVGGRGHRVAGGSTTPRVISRSSNDDDDRKVTLRWSGPEPKTMIESMTPLMRTHAHGVIERALTESHKADREDETVWWLDMIEPLMIKV